LPTGAWPLGAPGHGGLPRLHGKDEELAGVQFRASPKTEEWCGDRAIEESRGRGGGGWWGSSPFIVAEGGRWAADDNGLNTIEGGGA
jgi:hypothetical protein